MAGDGLLTDAEPLGYGAIGTAGRQQAEDLQLSLGKATSAFRCRRLAKEALRPTKVRFCSQPLQRRASCFQFQDTGILIVKLSICRGHQESYPGGLVRRFKLVPRSPRLPQRSESRGRLVLGQ